ncbi:meiosis-specific protein ASY2-like [Capsella rubella]|uniref:meiosis-specific protein ASY2-like n=1 Tax=Capsella rubella TaxID=81985 RepID=UPI000CD541D9|nr:meiosis-specific protein ASY2-like [Capsella rubella]
MPPRREIRIPSVRRLADEAETSGNRGHPSSGTTGHVNRCNSGNAPRSSDLTAGPSSRSSRSINRSPVAGDGFVPLNIFEEDISSILDFNGRIGGDPTRSDEATVRATLNVCGQANKGVTYIIPRPNQRPWNLPKGYICMYEAYFRDCHLCFPISSLLSLYAHRRNLAICQLTPAGVCNFTGILTIAAEVGCRVGVCLFKVMTTLKQSKVAGTWVVNMAPRHNILPGKKTTRPVAYGPLTAEIQAVKNALLRGPNREWKYLSRQRVERAMEQGRRLFPNIADVLREFSQDSQGNHDEVNIPDETAAPALVEESALGDETRAAEIVPAGAQQEGRKKKKKDKGKGLPASEGDQSRKRSASDAGLDFVDQSVEPFRAVWRNEKTDKFTFDYFGEGPLSMNSLASAHLCRNIKISSKLWAKTFTERSTFTQMVANPNTMLFKYHVWDESHATSEQVFAKMKNCYEDGRAKIKDLAAKVASLEKDLEVEKKNAADLMVVAASAEEDRKKAQSDLDDVCNKLASETRRFRKDRWEKVERTRIKAQGRLDRVRAYLTEQGERARPHEDKINQSIGIDEMAKDLVKEGIVIPEKKMAEIAGLSRYLQGLYDKMSSLKASDLELQCRRISLAMASRRMTIRQNRFGIRMGRMPLFFGPICLRHRTT